jgi:hypothetical protein
VVPTPPLRPRRLSLDSIRGACRLTKNQPGDQQRDSIHYHGRCIDVIRAHSFGIKTTPDLRVTESCSHNHLATNNLPMSPFVPAAAFGGKLHFQGTEGGCKKQKSLLFRVDPVILLASYLRTSRVSIKSH